MSWEEEDRKLVFSAVEELEDYLSSDQLQWRLSDSRGWLTPGNLILGLRRLTCIHSQNPSADLNSAVDTFQRIQDRRRAAWERKVNTEIPYRLRLWTNSLEEFKDEGVIDPSFAAQVKNRVLVELLMDESRMIPPQIKLQIDEADDNLKGISTPGEFIWDSLLSNCFTNDKFWFLYLRTDMVVI